MTRDDWCKVHGWTEHTVSDDCYCLEPADDSDPNGYAHIDEHGDCVHCESTIPVCILCKGGAICQQVKTTLIDS